MAKNKGTTTPPAPPAPPAPEVTREPGDEPEAPETQDTVAADARVVPHKASQVASLADVGNMMEADASESQGHGFERGDVAIPFLRMLQSNSPQVKRKDPAYVDGAEEGSFFNTVTQQVFDGDPGVFFVPVVFQRQATLWWPRETGGPKGEKGFVREVPIPEAEKMLRDNTEKNEKGKDVVKEGPHKGQELVFAAMYYGFLVTDPESGSFEPVAYPLTSTQLKKARMWNALIQGVRLQNSTGVGTYNPKMYGVAYRLTAVAESNAKGQWSGVKIAKDRPLLEYTRQEDGSFKPEEKFPNGAQLYLAAREFETLMSSGRVKVKHEDMAGGGDDTAAVSGEEDTEDKKLPF